MARRFEQYTALDIVQAIHIVRCYPEADAYISFSERIGIPLGMILACRKRRPAHLMIAHRLDTRAKRLLATVFRWPLGVDRIVTVCSAQQRYAEVFAPGRSVFVKAGVADEQFYCPSSDLIEEGYVLSVGSESRDYETLIAAVLKTDLKLKILSSSPWCRRKQYTSCGNLDRVEFMPHISYLALRDLYHRARLVVVPLHDVDYAAGHNGVIEAFCAGKPLIVSQSRGIADYVNHRQNAYVVPPADVEAMADALRTVWTDDALAADLRRGAASAVRDYASLDAYCKALWQEIKQTCNQVGTAAG